MSILQEIEHERRRLTLRNKWMNDFGVSVELAEALENIIIIRSAQLGFTETDGLRTFLSDEIRYCQALQMTPSRMVRYLFQLEPESMEH
jgi:hypothetical protein